MQNTLITQSPAVDEKVKAIDVLNSHQLELISDKARISDDTMNKIQRK